MTAKWPQTGIRVATVDEMSYWIRRMPTLGSTVHWRLIEYRGEAKTWSRDFRSLKAAKVAAEKMADNWRALLTLPTGEP